MIVTPEFPEHRLQDPRRQAEWRVYQEIAGSQAPGRALYEMRAGLHVPQLDFGIWLQDVAHYGLQVKGGETATEGGEWRLHSANGPETIPSPIAQTFDAAIAIRDIIKAQLNRKVLIFPVLCFPDMVPDPIIEARAAEGHVTVFWGGDDLIGRLKELAKTQTIHRPPTAERIAQEVELIQPGMGHLVLLIPVLMLTSLGSFGALVEAQSGKSCSNAIYRTPRLQLILMILFATPGAKVTTIISSGLRMEAKIIFRTSTHHPWASLSVLSRFSSGFCRGMSTDRYLSNGQVLAPATSQRGHPEEAA